MATNEAWWVWKCSLPARVIQVCTFAYTDRRIDALGAGVLERSQHITSPLLQDRTGYRILHHMVQYQQSHFDATFAALADATRRGVLEQLRREDASITDLAQRFRMTLTGMKKHVGVLEKAGLVTTEKQGRVRTCKLGRRELTEEAAWIEQHRQLWAARFDELDTVVEELQRKNKVDGRKNKR